MGDAMAVVQIKWSLQENYVFIKVNKSAKKLAGARQ